MKVLITGGAGFIGSHTADRLLKEGYEVRILDSFEQPVHHESKIPKYLDDRIQIINGDVTNEKHLEAALDGVDIVYHFAAFQDYLPLFSKFVEFNVTSKGDWEVKSSDGRSIFLATTPETVSNPQNPYGMSKISEEMFALQLGKRYKIPTVAMRYSIVQGSRQSFYNAYSGACRVFCLAFSQGKEPQIYEDGQQVRDFVNIHDVVDANLLVLNDERADYEMFNVGGGKAITVSEFASACAEVFGVKNYQPKPCGKYRFGDTRHICSDISKLEKLGWKPTRTIYDSIKEYKGWLSQAPSLDNIIEECNEKMKKLNVLRDYS